MTHEHEWRRERDFWFCACGAVRALRRIAVRFGIATERRNEAEGQ